MEPQAVTDYDEKTRQEIFSWLDVPFDAVTDLDGFENYVYKYKDEVLRITHECHRTETQLLGEVEFLEYLAAKGASVAAPLNHPDGSLVKSIGPFHICRFRAANGQKLSYDQPFTSELIREWGRCVGEFHRLVQDFEPKYPRQDWRNDENHDFHKRIPSKQVKVIEAGDELLSDLGRLPTSKETYGLIHSDAHAGNFVEDAGSLTFFDFDDCLYTWFGYDIATILFGASLQYWVPENETSRVKAVNEFFSDFLDGYLKESSTAAIMLEHMPLFLKLREFSLYAVIYAHDEAEVLSYEMAAKFFKGRQERLEERVPFLPIDFTQYG